MSKCQIDSGDTTWVLISTILVLGMMPALALFELGLLRAKNALSIICQVISGIVSLSVLWDLCGYSLTYGEDNNGIIGGIENFLLIGVAYNDCNANHANTIPSALFALFEMMFAVISPLLLTGAYAERVRLRISLMITILWEIFVFYPLAHWIWGGGFFSAGSDFAVAYGSPVLDFAGGIVIHTAAGTSALVIAAMVGKRIGFEKNHGEFPPSNLPMAFVGAGLLWLGWFGFNAGSALSSGQFAVSAVMSTQIGASCSGLAWLILSACRNRPSSVALLNGVIAGLAGITPASGYIDNQSSLVLGLIIGIASFYSCIFVKQYLQIDDALDVSSVHGLTGIIGSLAIGFCASKDVYPVQLSGLFYGGNGTLLGIQLIGVLVAMTYSAVVTYLIVIFTRSTIGLRISEAEELEGLDLVEHGEFAHHNLMLVGHEKYGEVDDMHSAGGFYVSAEELSNSYNLQKPVFLKKIDVSYQKLN